MHATIHIGTGKTGTSSIQHLLCSNYELLREQDCLYPALHPRRRLIDHNPLTMHLAFGWPMEPLSLLRSELTASGCRHLLISSEFMSEHLKSPELVMRLKHLLLEVGCSHFTIVVWLREPGALFASLCSQFVKGGRPEYRHTMGPQANPRFRSIMDSRGILRRWMEVFGREALRVRLFERQTFVNGDLLQDAIAAFGLAWDERFAIPPRVNEGLNLLETELLRVINHLQPGHPAAGGGTPKSWILEVLHRHAGVLDGSQLRFVPPQAVVRAWREWAAEGNEWVRQEFFPDRTTLFAPPKEQAENYELRSMTPGCWEALGRVLCELGEENFRLRRQLQQLRSEGVTGRASGRVQP